MKPTPDQEDSDLCVKARKPGYVYFIQADETQLIKIGWGRSPEARLATLQIGCPDELELLAFIESDDAPTLEGHLHYRFDRFRARGEWFRPVPELISYIEENARPYPFRSVADKPAPAAEPALPPAPPPAPSRPMNRRLQRYLVARGLPI